MYKYFCVAYINTINLMVSVGKTTDYWNDFVKPAFADYYVLEKGILAVETNSINSILDSKMRVSKLDQYIRLNALRLAVVTAYESENPIRFMDTYTTFLYEKACMKPEFILGGCTSASATKAAESYLQLAEELNGIANDEWLKTIFAFGWAARARYDDITINA